MNTKTDIKLSPACVAAEEYERRNPNHERSGTELYNAFMAGVSWQARAALQSQDREDAERLDWLDSMNAKLNSHYGTTYRWKLVLSPNVVRLMSGAGGNGHVAAIDLHDSEAHGALSCREAIDHARRIEGDGG